MSLKLIIKTKISEICRGINEFKEGYQLRINIIKDENGNLLADPQSVLNRWKNFFNQVINVHGVHDVRQMDIHTAEQSVPEPSLVEVEIVIGKLKSYKSPGTDNIPAELIKAGGETLCFEICKLVIYGIMRNCHSSGRNLLLYQFIKRVIRLTVIIIEEPLSYQLPTKFYPTFFWPG
jgi:prolipoprotein diacylglyceryltransferase